MLTPFSVACWLSVLLGTICNQHNMYQRVIVWANEKSFRTCVIVKRTHYWQVRGFAQPKCKMGSCLCFSWSFRLKRWECLMILRVWVKITVILNVMFLDKTFYILMSSLYPGVNRGAVRVIHDNLKGVIHKNPKGVFMHSMILRLWV